MPKININIFCLTIIFFWQTHLSANSLKDVLVEAIDKDRSCFSYIPNIGKVTDIDNLDVKSDQFEITDEKVLILNGNVELDFPDGTMFAGKARIDRTNGSVEFKKNGDTKRYSIADVEMVIAAPLRESICTNPRL